MKSCARSGGGTRSSHSVQPQPPKSHRDGSSVTAAAAESVPSSSCGGIIRSSSSLEDFGRSRRDRVRPRSGGVTWQDDQRLMMPAADSNAVFGTTTTTASTSATTEALPYFPLYDPQQSSHQTPHHHHHAQQQQPQHRRTQLPSSNERNHVPLQQQHQWHQRQHAMRSPLILCAASTATATPGCWNPGEAPLSKRDTTRTKTATTATASRHQQQITNDPVTSLNIPRMSSHHQFTQMMPQAATATSKTRTSFMGLTFQQPRQSLDMNVNQNQEHQHNSSDSRGMALPSARLKIATTATNDNASTLAMSGFALDPKASSSSLSMLGSAAAAATWARQAPQAGFLLKMGQAVPTLKRRFFVLQPGTYLYYFLSPADTQPRGCLDLEGALIVERDEDLDDGDDHDHDDDDVDHNNTWYHNDHDHMHATRDGGQNRRRYGLGELPDGRYRFALVWKQPQPSQQQASYDHIGGVREDNYPASMQQQPRQQRVLLEARSKQVAIDWIQALQTERLSYWKDQAARASRKQAAYQSRVQDLEQQVASYRLIEQELQGAWHDVATSRTQMQDLDTALQQLTQQVVRRCHHVVPDARVSSSSVAKPEKEKQQLHDTAQNHDDDITAATSESSKSRHSHREGLTDPVTGGDETVSEQCVHHNSYNDAGTGNDVQNTTTAQDGNKHEDDALKKASVDSEKVATTNREHDSAPTASEKELTSCDRIESKGLDDKSNNLQDEIESIDVNNVPGQHFAALYNACRQLQDHWWLASQEASTAVRDLQTTQQQLQQMEKRMTKAEQHLCTLWEENCTLRKSMKQTKREKRLLVREVKNLMEVNHQLSAAAAASSQRSNGAAVKENGLAASFSTSGVIAPGDVFSTTTTTTAAMTAADDSSSAVVGGDEEEKLIHDLEEHLASSIRLHEQLLGGADRASARCSAAGLTQSATSSLSDYVTSSSAGTRQEVESVGATVKIDITSSQRQIATARHSERHHYPTSIVPQRALLSLVDDDDPSEEDETDGDMDQESQSGATTASLSSVQVELSQSGSHHDEKSINIEPAKDADSKHDLRTNGESNSPGSTPNRTNPLNHLDDEDEGIDSGEGGHDRLHGSSLQFDPTRSIVINIGQATSNLKCPLTDVVGSDAGASGDLALQDHTTLDVYHLTFYSQKIGLQFQKVPPPPVKAKGLLTEAMTADLNGTNSSDKKMAAELRRIAAFSRELENANETDTVCKVAKPIDAVLVCGFQGFDSGSKVRPKLGARLVAFDGVSVEVGRWTFDSIRKAIQARSRPLTLSFRNDFLTTEQRTILTRAAKEVEAAAMIIVAPLQPRAVLQYNSTTRPQTPSTWSSRPPSTEPSLPSSTQSALSHDTDRFINDMSDHNNNSNQNNNSVTQTPLHRNPATSCHDDHHHQHEQHQRHGADDDDSSATGGGGGGGGDGGSSTAAENRHCMYKSPYQRHHHPYHHSNYMSSFSGTRCCSVASSSVEAISTDDRRYDHYPQYDDDSRAGGDYLLRQQQQRQTTIYEYSFSQAGTSTVIGSSRSSTTTTPNRHVLSAVGPLVANLLGNSNNKSNNNNSNNSSRHGRRLKMMKAAVTPEYLRRQPASVEDTPQHMDFASELL